MAGAFEMAMRARHLSGNPLRMPRPGSDPAIKARRDFPADRRSTGADTLKETGIERFGLRFADIDNHLDAGIAQPGNAASANS